MGDKEHYEVSDDPLRDKIVLGQRAAGLLNDELLRDFLNELESGIVTTWMNTKSGDVVARERAWFALTAVRRLRELLGLAAANGRVAQSDLDRLIANEEV